MTKKDQLVKKINTLLETSSEEQLVLIDATLKEIITSNVFRKKEDQQSSNFTRNGMQSMLTDVEEGNWGSLYRNNS